MDEYKSSKYKDRVTYIHTYKTVKVRPVYRYVHVIVHFYAFHSQQRT